MKCPKKQSKYRQRVFIKLPLCIIHARRDKAKCFLIVWNRAALGLLSFLTFPDFLFRHFINLTFVLYDAYQNSYFYKDKNEKKE